MRYMGSKGRHAKHIVPFLMDGHNDNLPYIEPFVGGGNMIQHVPASVRQGSDLDKDAIATLNGLANGWSPPETLSEDEYFVIKQCPEIFDPALVGFAKFSCSFGGKAWGGFARGDGRNFANEQARTLRKEASRLKGCQFTVQSYRERDYPLGSTIYCDPPYANSTGYERGSFDHEQFWQFCRDLSRDCRVFVSEYIAPADWGCVWKRETGMEIMSESDIQRATQLLAAQHGIALWRNNSGALQNSRGEWVRYGLGNISKKYAAQVASSDLIGVTPVTITPDMVGQTVGVFTAVESKREGWTRSPTDKREKAQAKFHEIVQAHGGLAGFAASPEELWKIVKGG